MCGLSDKYMLIGGEKIRMCWEGRHWILLVGKENGVCWSGKNVLGKNGMAVCDACKNE